MGGGDASPFTGADTIPVVADACPNGWPASAINPMGADGCSVLDAVWDAGPFASQAAFEARVREVAGTNADAIIAATANPVGGPDNACANRIAFTFDDGPSFYRPQTLAVFRAKQARRRSSTSRCGMSPTRPSTRSRWPRGTRSRCTATSTRG